MSTLDPSQPLGNLVAAHLQRVEVAMLSRILTTTLAGALPAAMVQVERRRSLGQRLTGRAGPAIGVSIISGDKILRFRAPEVGRTEATVSHAVRGVVLSTDNITVADWLSQLAEVLNTATDHDEATRTALRRTLVTDDPAISGLALQAVLFDMDGTLVDTEPYWIAAEYALVESFGGTWNDEHAHAIVGSALLDAAAYLREHGGVDLDPPVIVERLLDDVVQASLREIPWRPGARELLAELAARGVPCALVTMSYSRLAATMTDQLPTGTFGAVVTGDQVSDGKPHPEAYLTAIERLGVQASRCVAIEDSPTGVASAEAAGAIVVAIPHHVTVAAAPGRVMVASLTDVDVATLDALVRQC